MSSIDGKKIAERGRGGVESPFKKRGEKALGGSASPVL